MRVFLTGATGFIGTAVIPELIKAGHQVLGLARSDTGAAALTALGAQVQRGALEDLDSLRRGASEADGVIHAGFIHDFSKFAENCETDRRAIGALGETLAGSGRPLIVTSGTGFGAPGHLRNEDEPPTPPSAHMPRVSEQAGAAAAALGVRVSAVRLPQVHDTVKQGLITYLVDIARSKGVSAYIGDGANRWPACERFDAARVFHLALEKGVAGARYHAVGEQGVPVRRIAETIARGLKVPAVSLSAGEAAAHFGPFAGFVGADMPASSALTQERLGWKPTGVGLIEDLEAMRYFV